jgi:hypothetical protein
LESFVCVLVAAMTSLDIWVNAWLGDQKRQIRESISTFVYEVESLKKKLYKFFVVYEIQLNQKNYNDFKFSIIINIKIDQNLVKV